MSITIHQVWGRIGMRTDWAELKLSLLPCSFNLEIVPPQLNLSISKPEIEIDHTQAREGQGYYGWGEYARRMAAEEKINVLEATAEISRVGDELMRIEQGIPDLIAKQAAEISSHTVEPGIGPGPPAGPEISLAPGVVEADLDRGQVDVLYSPGQIRNYTPRGGVEIWLAQEPKVYITA